MYTPPDTRNLSTMPPNTQSPMRILLQGAAGTGKTWAALTFPNPIVLDFDNKLTAHRGKDVSVIPFWDAAYVSDVLKFKNKAGQQPNRKDALKQWLIDHGPKLEPEQTLILDSWTKVQDVFDYQHTDVQKFYTKQGDEDGFMFWRVKLQYNQEIFNLFTGLRCNFAIIICHEQQQRDKDGFLCSKIEPLQSGQFCAKMSSYVTDTWRQCVFDKVDEKGNVVYVKDKVTGKDTKERMSDWMWQVRSSSEVNLNCSLDRGAMPQYIPANYNELKKYLPQ